MSLFTYDSERLRLKSVLESIYGRFDIAEKPCLNKIDEFVDFYTSLAFKRDEINVVVRMQVDLGDDKTWLQEGVVPKQFVLFLFHHNPKVRLCGTDQVRDWNSLFDLNKPDESFNDDRYLVQSLLKTYPPTTLREMGRHTEEEARHHSEKCKKAMRKAVPSSLLELFDKWDASVEREFSQNNGYCNAIVPQDEEERNNMIVGLPDRGPSAPCTHCHAPYTILECNNSHAQISCERCSAHYPTIFNFASKQADGCASAVNVQRAEKNIFSHLDGPPMVSSIGYGSVYIQCFFGSEKDEDFYRFQKSGLKGQENAADWNYVTQQHSWLKMDSCICDKCIVQLCENGDLELAYTDN